MPDPGPRRWLTTSQAAALIAVDRKTVWRWAQMGVIPPGHLLHIGRHTRIARVWCEENTTTSPA